MGVIRTEGVRTEEAKILNVLLSLQDVLRDSTSLPLVSRGLPGLAPAERAREEQRHAEEEHVEDVREYRFRSQFS